jgi:hypothetical protein
VFQDMGVSKMALRGKPKLCGVSVSALRAELSEAVSSVWPAAHEGSKGNGFRGNVGEDIKRMSRNDVREVRDYSNAVPGVRSFIGRSVNGWCGMRKSRVRVRM